MTEMIRWKKFLYSAEQRIAKALEIWWDKRDRLYHSISKIVNCKIVQMQ